MGLVKRLPAVLLTAVLAAEHLVVVIVRAFFAKLHFAIVAILRGGLSVIRAFAAFAIRAAAVATQLTIICNAVNASNLTTVAFLCKGTTWINSVLFAEGTF
jgi:hypothetical protein